MPPLAIAAGVTAAASIGGAALSARAQSKASKAAAASAAQTADKNNALTLDVYNRNRSALSPFMDTGQRATGAINELLGLAPLPLPPTPLAPPSSPPQYQNGNMLAPFTGGGFGRGWNGLAARAGPMPEQGGRFNPGDMISWGAWARPAVNAPLPIGNTQAPATPPATIAPSPSARSAFDNYRDSTGYQFRVGEGMDAINTGYAARGLLESGAAQKALVKYGQDYGSGEFGNYLGYLQGQQALGAQSASALAGVGQNYANTVSANNNNAGAAAGNAALVRGAAQGQLYGGVANAFGNFAGSLGSSYGGGGNAGGLYSPQMSFMGQGPVVMPQVDYRGMY